MTDSDLKNSITLIGPSSVGKSLIASALSKRTKMPIVCIDDLLVMIEYEKNGDLSPNPEIQKLFMRRCAQEIVDDPAFQPILRNKELKKKEIELIRDMVKLYKSYLKMFGSLEIFYDILNRYQKRISLASMPAEKIMNLNIVSCEIMFVAVKMLKEPIIFDVPASFGWNASDLKNLNDLKFGGLKRYADVDFKEVKIVMQSFLDLSNTVLLSPGQDYEQRNGAKESKENQILLNHFKNYYDNAKIEITTNAVFNEPNNEMLKRRSWLDAEEAWVKDRLKNKAEIANICDEILEKVEELNYNLTN